MDTSVYSEAKGEYTKQLTLFIVPTFHRFFMDCLQQASTEEPQVKRQLWKFQEILSQIPEWNMDKVQRETARLIQQIQCDYLEELLTAVFIAHTKVLTAIRIGNKNKRVQITVPKLDHFLHRALSESSRLLWSSAYLFHNELSPIEKQKNHRQIEQLLHEGIAQAIRGLLPVKNILKDYLAEPDADADDELDDEDEVHHPSTKEEHEKVEEGTTPDKENTSEHNGVEKSDDMEETHPEMHEKEGEIHMEEKVPEKIETIPEVSPSQQSSLSESSSPESSSIPPSIPESSSPESSSPQSSSPPLSPPTIPANPPPTPMIPLIQKEPEPVTPTLIVETEPSVLFTDFDQVIQQRNGHTHIDYVEQDRDDEYNDQIHFVDNEGEPLSDFEDLTDGPTENLNSDDFETL